MVDAKFYVKLVLREHINPANLINSDETFFLKQR